jgi:hypothetical protein
MFKLIKVLIFNKYNYKQMIAKIEGVVKSVTRSTNQKNQEIIEVKLLQDKTIGTKDYSEFTMVRVSPQSNYEKGQELEMDIIQERFDINGRTFIVNKEI